MLSVDASKQNNETNSYIYYTNGPERPEKLTCAKYCKCQVQRKKDGDKNIPGYQFLKLLGSGAYGAVHLYQPCRKRKPVAIKSMSYISPQGRNIFYEVTSEYDIVMHIEHPNILKYFTCFTNAVLEKCYIVMEYASRGSLRKLIDAQQTTGCLFQPRFILRTIRGIISGVQSLNYHHVVHCDLKPENILLGNDSLMKISDFGTAHYDFDINASLALTAIYMAPEQFDNVRPNEKTEVWAIGIIMYELCYLQHPFRMAKTIHELVRLVRSGQLAPYPDCYGADMFLFMESMLCVNSQHRNTLVNLLEDNVFR